MSESIKVQFTNQYDLFRVMGANRMINKSHVQQLIDSIEERPNTIKYSPILVNENMYVIDGQHRLEALKELKMPVYFIVGKGLTVEDARLMNATMQNWSPMDFARSYAEGGNKHYKDYLYVRSRFKSNHTITANYLANGWLWFAQELVADCAVFVEESLNVDIFVAEYLQKCHAEVAVMTDVR